MNETVEPQSEPSPDVMINRLALGTVQFGLPYGVANRTGQPPQGGVKSILTGARAAGIDTLDTAVAYGESEARLGEIGVRGWRVVTKVPALPTHVSDVGTWVRASVNGSLERLGLSSVAGLLLHCSTDLLGDRGPALAAAIRRERDEGRVEKIGVSIYDPTEIDAIWPVLVPDLVQAPLNILDRRLETSGWLHRLHAEGREVHARSAFLQGLLLLPTDKRPPRFARWNEVWMAWSNWLAATKMPPLQAALGHVMSYPEVSRVVVGVDDASQLSEILGAASKPPVTAPMSLATNDMDLINPSRWNSL